MQGLTSTIITKFSQGNSFGRYVEDSYFLSQEAHSENFCSGTEADQYFVFSDEAVGRIHIFNIRITLSRVSCSH